MLKRNAYGYEHLEKNENIPLKNFVKGLLMFDSSQFEYHMTLVEMMTTILKIEALAQNPSYQNFYLEKIEKSRKCCDDLEDFSGKGINFGSRWKFSLYYIHL